MATQIPNDAVKLGTEILLQVDGDTDAPRSHLSGEVPERWKVSAYECDAEGEWWYVLETRIPAPWVSYNKAMNVGVFDKDLVTVTHRVLFSGKGEA